MAKSDLLQVERTIIDVSKGDLYTIKLTDRKAVTNQLTNRQPA
jgi:hypothetical protein